MTPVDIPGLGNGPRLEGLWHGTGSRSAVVASPHPLMGGHMRTPPGEALIAGLVERGLRVLAFNFRGVGASEGKPSPNPGDADADFLAALALAADSGDPSVAAGYSFGGATAIRVAADGALSVIALAPPPALFPEAALAAIGSRATVVVGDGDPIARPLEQWVTRPGGTLHWLSEEDHFFGDSLEAIRRIARETDR